MSAFIVGKAHIDALVVAGLKLGRRHGEPMTWFAQPLTQEDERDAYQRGEPWGPRSIQLANERRRELTGETAERVGQMLWAENQHSVNHRYDEEEWEEVYTFDHRMAAWSVPIDPIKVIGAIACYRYQTCEHPEWERSEASQYVDALERACIRALPGYDDAPWEVHSLLEISRDMSNAS